jgi:hypothetical protein
MNSSPANWTGLFQGDNPDDGVEIFIEEDEVTEATSDSLMAMPEYDEEVDDEYDPIYDYEDVTEDLVPLEGLAATEDGDEDEEQASQPEDWPRSFEDHLRHIRSATRDENSAQALAIFGLGDVQGSETTAAAIAKTWEDLRFWEPMLELGRSGDFSGHLGDLRKCMALLEANPPSVDRPLLLERWEQARSEVRRNLPGSQSAAATDLKWQQNVARGRNAKISVIHEDVA